MKTELTAEDQKILDGVRLRTPAIPVTANELAILKTLAKSEKWMKPYLEHLFVPPPGMDRARLKARLMKKCGKKHSKR